MAKNSTKTKSSAKSEASNLYYDLGIAVTIRKTQSKTKAAANAKNKSKVSH